MRGRVGKAAEEQTYPSQGHSQGTSVWQIRMAQGAGEVGDGGGGEVGDVGELGGWQH